MANRANSLLIIGSITDTVFLSFLSSGGFMVLLGLVRQGGGMEL
jgi:hypothetical protein